MRTVSELRSKISGKISQLFNNNGNEDDDDAYRPKIIENLFHLLIFLTTKLDILDALGGVAAKRVVEWIKAFVENCAMTQQDIVRT